MDTKTKITWRGLERSFTATVSGRTADTWRYVRHGSLGDEKEIRWRWTVIGDGRYLDTGDAATFEGAKAQAELVMLAKEVS